MKQNYLSSLNRRAYERFIYEKSKYEIKYLEDENGKENFIRELQRLRENKINSIKDVSLYCEFYIKDPLYALSEIKNRK